MKLPGGAWLEFEVTGDEQRSTIRRTAIFDPVGLSGLLYGYGVYPLHQLVFAGMLRSLAHAAQLHRHELVSDESRVHDSPDSFARAGHLLPFMHHFALVRIRREKNSFSITSIEKDANHGAEERS